MVAYEGKEPYVFVSYAHKDKNKVMPLVEGLQKRGFRVWYDKRGISAGSEWAEVIADHLENCRCMVAFVSRSFGASNNCREELNYAKELKKTILVVYLEDRQNLRGAVRLRLGTLHSMSLDDYADHGEFLNELSGEEALQPCLGAAAVPVSTPDPASEKPADSSAEKLFEQGLAYYANNQNEDAVRFFRQAADQGHVRAQVYLGISYQYGFGVDKNPDEAMRWYRTAAEQGSAEEQSILAARYDNGDCVQRDVREAAKWWRKAAEQGYAPAQYYLGNCYWYGRGVRKNRAEARKWYQKAADQGDEDAIQVLKNL